MLLEEVGLECCLLGAFCSGAGDECLSEWLAPARWQDDGWRLRGELGRLFLSLSSGEEEAEEEAVLFFLCFSLSLFFSFLCFFFFSFFPDFLPTSGCIASASSSSSGFLLVVKTSGALATR